MSATLWTRLDKAARHSSPVMLCAILTVLDALPIHLTGLRGSAPLWALMAIYAWVIYRPDLMPAAAAFVVGFLHDVLSGAPIGLNALVFIAFHAVALAQRRFFFDKPFLLFWLGFTIESAGAFAGTWFLTSLWYQQLLDPTPTMLQFAFTAICFPLMASVIVGWQRLFLRYD